MFSETCLVIGDGIYTLLCRAWGHVKQSNCVTWEGIGFSEANFVPNRWRLNFSKFVIEVFAALLIVYVPSAKCCTDVCLPFTTEKDVEFKIRIFLYSNCVLVGVTRKPRPQAFLDYLGIYGWTNTDLSSEIKVLIRGSARSKIRSMMTTSPTYMGVMHGALGSRS